MTTDLRNKWFASLASLTYPQSPEHAAEAFRAYLPMTAYLPDGAFTQRSLEAVVMAPRKMAIPSYDEICKPLGTWWRENRPFVTALPTPSEPRRVPPTAEERAVVSALTRQALAAIQQAAPTPARGELPPIRAHYCGDGHLLMENEALARAGSTVAAYRAEMLRAKILAAMNVDTAREREMETLP